MTFKKKDGVIVGEKDGYNAEITELGKCYYLNLKNKEGKIVFSQTLDPVNQLIEIAKYRIARDKAIIMIANTPDVVITEKHNEDIPF